MTGPHHTRIIRLSDAQQRIPGPAGEHAVSVFQRGALSALLALGRFAPQPPRPQSSHAQDEIYVVVRGRGVLAHGSERDSFEAGDLLFVPAGAAHRFEDVSEDLTVWVVFFGDEMSALPGD